MAERVHSDAGRRFVIARPILFWWVGLPKVNGAVRKDGLIRLRRNNLGGKG